MKKILVLLSLVSLVAWMVSFLSMNYTPIVNVFLLLSILFYIRSVLVMDMPAGSAVTADGPVIPVSHSEK